jgi:CDP-diacylglycerol--glycerol-3-phosphate 3-phosphatidyltransferase
MAINKNIPNILTLSRLLLVPVFIVFIFLHSIEARIIFLILFIYASITDFLDGYLARKYDLKSNFGRVFDPIADKALVLVIFVFILVKNFEYSIYISVPMDGIASEDWMFLFPKWTVWNQHTSVRH